MSTSLPTFSIAWTREQLDGVRAAAWATWISYGANVRRIFTAAWFEAQTTALAPVPKAEVVTPDEIIPPGQHIPRRHGYKVPRWYYGNV